MQDKVVLITGATSGVGLETARGLAAQGAVVVVAGRDAAKAAATVADIRATSGNSNVDSLLADLSEMRQVESLARQFLQRYQRLDVLVNNAGAFNRQRRETADGYELTFAVNHLAYFLLTQLLLDTLVETGRRHGGARIINVSSRAHQRIGGLNFDDLHARRGYFGLRAYARSKLANVLFTYEQARRLEGEPVTVNALHPGFVSTGMGRNNGWLYDMGYSVINLFALTPVQGADTMVYLAASPEVEGVSGKYFYKRRAVPTSRASYDLDGARRLWDISQQSVQRALAASPHSAPAA